MNIETKLGEDIPETLVKAMKISRVLEGEPVSFEGNDETITVIVQQKPQETHGSEFYSEIGRKVTRLTTDESQ